MELYLVLLQLAPHSGLQWLQGDCIAPLCLTRHPRLGRLQRPGPGEQARTKKNRRPYHGTLLLYRILHIFWLRLVAKICRLPQFFQFFRASIIKIFARDIQIRATTCIDLHAWALPSFYSCMLDYALAGATPLQPTKNPKTQKHVHYISYSLCRSGANGKYFFRYWKIHDFSPHNTTKPLRHNDFRNITKMAVTSKIAKIQNAFSRFFSEIFRKFFENFRDLPLFYAKIRNFPSTENL